jgi:3-hydroxyacyl-CoA dehydrogenase
VPEIADEIFQIDRAMRWGYANKLGPFELWDALGFEDVCKRLEQDKRNIPENVQTMRKTGADSMYKTAFKASQVHKQYFDFIDSEYKPFADRPSLMELKRAGNVVKSNSGASLIDLGDGVLCCEFHSKMNSLGEDQIGMIYSGINELQTNFEAMVIANQGENFSVGANLMLVLLAAQEQEWDELNAAIHRFQQATMALKYAPKPVVAAPFSRALGGGCEIPIHCTRIQASAETYMGLVEVGVGLIPGAGGTKEMILRLQDARKAFELIGMAKVSSSAEEARQLGFLTTADRISMNPNRLIEDAKDLSLSLVKDYRPGTPRTDVKVGGESAFAMLKLGAWTLRQGGYISDYDVVVAEKLANVLSGGRLTGEQTVSEQYLLDLEREAFLSLCGNPKTQERMQFMLKTGKPLRN